jgi:hypothetical protein
MKARGCGLRADRQFRELARGELAVAWQLADAPRKRKLSTTERTTRYPAGRVVRKLKGLRFSSTQVRFFSQPRKDDV